MTSFSIRVVFGNSSFSAEADHEHWVEAQYSKFLETLKNATELRTIETAAAPEMSSSKNNEILPALATHLRAKDATSNQVRRFLATADWLGRKGNKNLSTSMVAKALSDNQQSKLSNPSECLNKNVAKGHCEKSADGFFVTPDGLRELGYE